MKNKSMLVWLCPIVALLFFVGLQISSYVQNYAAISTGNARNERILQKQADTENVCIISNSQGMRMYHFSKYSASEQYIFFAYNENGSVIDAYDHNGVFQFSIIMPDARNGLIKICCTNNKLYAWTKEGALYIFEGSTQVGYITREEAKKTGYDFEYSYEPKNMRVDKSYIYLADNKKIPTPETIRNNWPNPLAKVCVLVLACVTMFILGRKRQKIDLTIENQEDRLTIKSQDLR